MFSVVPLYVVKQLEESSSGGQSEIRIINVDIRSGDPETVVTITPDLQPIIFMDCHVGWAFIGFAGRGCHAIFISIFSVGIIDQKHDQEE